MKKDLDFIDKIIKKISIRELRRIILYYWGNMPYSMYAYHKASEDNLIPGSYESFLKFLKENRFYVCILCSEEYIYRKLLLKKLLKVYKLKNINIDEMFDYILDNGIFKLEEKSTKWEKKYIPIICNDSVISNYIIQYSRNYAYSNGFGHSHPDNNYWILLYKERIVWFDCNCIDHPMLNPAYYIEFDNNIYGIDHYYQQLTICYNFSESFKNIQFDKPDDVLKKLQGKQFNYDIIIVNYSDCFYKGFFHRGTIYSEDWREKIDVLKNITFEDNLLKIEIENQTHPHSGYLWLDLESKKIIKSEASKKE